MPRDACALTGGVCTSMNAEVRDEQIRMIKVRVLADLTAYRLRHARLNREDGLALIVETRQDILALCPGKGDVFDLVLRPRFMRILDECVPARKTIAAELFN